jgi:hypothetical protein
LYVYDLVSLTTELIYHLHSISAATWCQCKRASRFQRVDKSETILREDKNAGKSARAKDYGTR